MKNLPVIEEGLPKYVVLLRKECDAGMEMLMAKKDYTTAFSSGNNRKPWVGYVETLKVRKLPGEIAYSESLPENPFCVNWPEDGRYITVTASQADVKDALRRIFAHRRKTPFLIKADYVPGISGLFSMGDFMATRGSRDEELVLSYLAGDRAAMEALLERYADTFTKLAGKMRMPYTNDEDKRQIARIAFLHAAPRYIGKNKASFRTYIQRCMKNALLNEQKRLMRHKRKPDRAPSMEDTYLGQEVDKQIYGEFLKRKRGKMLDENFLDERINERLDE